MALVTHGHGDDDPPGSGQDARDFDVCLQFASWSSYSSNMLSITHSVNYSVNHTLAQGCRDVVLDVTAELPASGTLQLQNGWIYGFCFSKVSRSNFMDSLAHTGGGDGFPGRYKNTTERCRLGSCQTRWPHTNRPEMKGNVSTTPMGKWRTLHQFHGSTHRTVLVRYDST